MTRPTKTQSLFMLCSLMSGFQNLKENTSIVLVNQTMRLCDIILGKCIHMCVQPQLLAIAHISFWCVRQSF